MMTGLGKEYMNRVSLKTVLMLCIGGFFAFLFSVATASYWLRARSQAALDRSFRLELSVISDIAHLTEGLRHLDDMTHKFLMTGDDLWLKQRRAALERMSRVQQHAGARLATDEERQFWRAFEQQLRVLLNQEEEWIRRKSAGRLPAAQVASIITGTGLSEQAIAELQKLKTVGVDEVRKHGDTLRQISLFTFGLVVCAGFAGSVLLAVFLGRLIVNPIEVLSRCARRWNLGDLWQPEALPAGREIQELGRHLLAMSERQNRRYEKEKEISNLKSDVVSFVSHEFNNGLTVIHAATVALQESEGSWTAEKRKQFYEMILGNTRALGGAATNLMEKGRLESGKLAVIPIKIEVRAVLRECLANLDILAKRKGLHITLELPEEPISVAADPQALMLVATNLLSNAIKYTPQNGVIAIRVYIEPGDGEQLRVEIKDNGIGIPPQDLKRIFSGHYRTERSQTFAQGMGLGLKLAQQIVESHGSRLDVESQLGRGSVFSFTLPVWTKTQDKESENRLFSADALEAGSHA